MTLGRTATLAAIVLLVGASAWWVKRNHAGTKVPPPTPAAERLALSWTGSSKGSTTLPIELDWCPIDRTARLWAVDRETGFVIVFYETDSLHMTAHRVIPPNIPVPPRPSATVAYRWAGDSALNGFTSMDGTVDLKGASQKSVAGSFALTLHHPTKPDTLRITGSFSGVPVVTKTAGCP